MIYLFRDNSKEQDVLNKVLFDVLEINPYSIYDSQYIDDKFFYDKLKEREDIEKVIIVGEPALTEICHVRGIKKYNGKKFKIDFEGKEIPVYPIVSPGYVKNNINYSDTYVQQLHDIFKPESDDIRLSKTNQHIIISDSDSIREYFSYVFDTKIFSFDFETTSLSESNYYNDDFKLTSISFSFQIGSSVVIPINHRDLVLDNDALETLVDCLRSVMANPSIIKVGHNLKFDLHCVYLLGIREFEGPFHDTILLHSLIEREKHSLKDIVLSYQPRYAHYDQEIKDYNWSEIPLDLQAQYNALDSDLTLRLYFQFTDYLINNDIRLYNLFRNLSSPALLALFKAEVNGMYVDKKYLEDRIKDTDDLLFKLEKKMLNYKEVKRFQSYMNELERDKLILDLEGKIISEEQKTYKSKKANENKEKRIKEYKETIKNLKAGIINVECNPVNFISSKQLSELLYSKQGFNFSREDINVTKRTSTLTGKEILLCLKDNTGFIDDLLAYRQLQKIQSTYLKGIKEKIDKNNYIHTNFNQHVTLTGRLSSDSPNLQNIITRTKYPQVQEAVKYVKNSFKVPEGYVLVSFDYSQAELRVIAHFAQEDTMLEAYKKGIDIHELTASKIFGMTIDEFRKLDPSKYKQKRYEAKSANFGLIYGMSAYGFMSYANTEYGLNITENKAKQIREEFFRTYSKLKAYHNLYIAKARKYGYVRTLFGRHVFIPDINHYNDKKRSHAERNAINSPIQGTAGEFTIFSFALLQYQLPSDILFVNTIHDSNLFYIPENKIDKYIPLIKEVMENLPTKEYFEKELSIDMKVDIELSKESWGQLKPYMSNN